MTIYGLAVLCVLFGAGLALADALLLLLTPRCCAEWLTSGRLAGPP